MGLLTKKKKKENCVSELKMVETDSNYLERTVTGHIDDSSFVLSCQWQKTSREIHRAKEIHIYLMFDDCICLPFEFTETHHTGIIY